MKRVLVCGGREAPPEAKDYIYAALTKVAEKWSKHYDSKNNWLPTDIVLINGLAKGVDAIAYNWAIANWCKIEEFPADWEKYGKTAGRIRNNKMLKFGKPDLVIAFPGGVGTAHMVRIAEKAGVPVAKMEYN